MSDEYSVTTNFLRGAITADDYAHKMRRVREREKELSDVIYDKHEQQEATCLSDVSSHSLPSRPSAA